MKVERIVNALRSGGVDEERARDLALCLEAMIRDDEAELREVLTAVLRLVPRGWLLTVVDVSPVMRRACELAGMEL
jgi:hypothetical protein